MGTYDRTTHKRNNMLYFTTGLPRSGSTLLQQLLGQNPNHYVSPTSGLIEAYTSTISTWRQWVSFRSEGLEKASPKIRTMLEGMLLGYYKEQLENKSVFDKNRGWLRWIGSLEDVLQREVKMLVTVRDVRGIIASFERMFQERGFDYNDHGVHTVNVESRTAHLLRVDREAGSMVGTPISFLREALKGKHSNRLMIISMYSLTSKPKEVLEKIHEWLELPEFEYNTEKVETITHEDDFVWGLGPNLHKVHQTIQPVKEYWDDFLPAPLSEQIAREYSDINQLAGVQTEATIL